MVEICTVNKNKASRAGPPSDPIPATWASYPTFWACFAHLQIGDIKSAYFLGLMQGLKLNDVCEGFNTDLAGREGLTVSINIMCRYQVWQEIPHG